MTRKIAFYMDEHVHPAITRGLRLRGADVLTAQDVKLLGIPDEQHLQFATNDNRVVFTNDDDFLKLHAQGMPHNGIAFAHHNTDVGRVVRGLTLIYEILSPKEMVNHVEFL